MSHTLGNDLSNQGTPDPVGTTPSESSDESIDAIFGTTHDDESFEGSRIPEDGTSQSSPGDEYENQNFLSKKTPQQFIAELQSGKDKAFNEIENLKKQNEELAGAAQFVHQLYEDPETFKAFVAEVDPNLVKPSSPEDYIKTNLEKEFGEDFVPDDSEASTPGSRTWLYNKRANDLYGEAMKASGQVPQTISELRKNRAKQQEESKAAAEKERSDIMAKFKWTDNDWQSFLQWGGKLSTMDLAQIRAYSLSKAKGNPSIPNLAGAPGGNTLPDNAYVSHLNNMFG
jgi:hypothetical protein